MLVNRHMGLKNNEVILENNYLKFKSIYEKEKVKLKEIFDACNIDVVIEHIGSTAIKNLYSKPIVDIAVGVEDLESIIKIKDKLSDLYTFKDNREYNEILLIKEDENETYCLIHVMEKCSKRYLDVIKFRDILNSNENVLKEYESLKKELAKIYSNDRKMYTKAKNDYIKNILKGIN